MHIPFLIMLFAPFVALAAFIAFVLLRLVYHRLCSYLLFFPPGITAKAKARIAKGYFCQRKIMVEGPPDVGVPWQLSLGRPPYRLFIAFCDFDLAMSESFWSDINKWRPVLKGHLFSVVSTSPWPNAALLHAHHFAIPVFRQSDLPAIRDAFQFPPATLHRRIRELAAAKSPNNPKV